MTHDDVIKWRLFPRYWPFVWGIHRWPVNSPHKGQWRGAFMFSLICAWINGWVNNREAGDLRHHRAHYDVIVMEKTGKLALLQISVFSDCIHNCARNTPRHWSNNFPSAHEITLVAMGRLIWIGMGIKCNHNRTKRQKIIQISHWLNCVSDKHLHDLPQAFTNTENLYHMLK